MKHRTDVKALGCVLLAVTMVLMAWGGTAAAQSVEEHFKGKQIRMLIGSSPGGGYDTFARTIAVHWARHIPGHPTFVPQNMPGPMSLPVANHLYTAAPKDGTVIGALNPQVASEAILNPERARFDARRLYWIGSALREVQTALAWRGTGVESFDDLFKRELIVGGSGGATDTFPTLTNAILGTKFKVVSGYPGTREVNLAMERGEVQGNGGITWASVKSTMGSLLDERKITVIAQYGVNKHPELPDVPHVLSYAKTPDDRSALMLLFATQEFGRPYVAPPDLPPAIAAALRTSFTATMRDPAFLDEAKQRRLDVDPTSGQEIQGLVDQLYASSPETIERVRKVFAQERK